MLSPEPKVITKVVEVQTPPKPLPAALEIPCEAILKELDISEAEWNALTPEQQVSKIVAHTAKEWAEPAKLCASKHNALVEWYYETYGTD